MNRRHFLAGAVAQGLIGVSSAEAKGIPGLYWPDTIAGHVSLTFDDGPHPRYTNQVLDVLAEHNLKATFFVCGRRVVTWPDTVRRIHKEGHCIGNHTWSHPALGKLSEAEIEKEFVRTQRAINKVLGFEYPVHYYRPPFGNPWFSSSSKKEEQKERVRRVVSRHNGMIILWQLSVGDTRPSITDDHLVKVAKRSLRDRKGGVYCMHDNNGRTVRALPRILAHLKQENIRIASIDELVNLKYFM